jgi:hypothetical protein
MSQLTDMFKGLMFLQGHVVHPEDATVPPAFGNRAASDQWFARHRGDGRASATTLAHGFSAIQHLQFLGGRPMHAGHNLDLDEPFEQLADAANDDASPHAACATC